MQRYRLFLTRLVCAVIAVALTGGPSSNRITKSSQWSSPSLFVAAQEYEWQECSTFLSPNMGSWAVYAARPFKADELVELTPFFIPLETHQSMYSVLDNYVFGFERGSSEASEVPDDQHLNVVLLGNGGFYNHNDNPNLRYVQVIAREGEDVPHLVGFRATRDIAAGEQLYVSYVDDPAKKLEWFEKRGIVADTPTEEKIDPNMLPFYASKFCSKIYGGVGAPTWKDNILPILQSIHDNVGSGTILPPSSWMDLTRLAPFDAGLSDARAKVPIKKGGHIEKSLGLVMSRNDVRGTPLGPIAFYWENLKIDHHQNLINLRDDNKLVLQYQGPDTKWESVDRFQGYSEMTVLPVSGNIGMVRRVGSGGEHGEEYNCKLMIRSNKDHGTNVGVTLELVATRDIAVGEVLKLNIAPSEFVEEYRLLHDEMEESGQPHHPGIFDPINDEEL